MPVLEPDLAEPIARRWVAFSASALDAGVRAVFAFPLRASMANMGALGLYPLRWGNGGAAPAEGSEGAGRAERDRRPQGARRRARGLRAHPVAGLPGAGNPRRRCDRLPPLLGAVRPARPPRRAAVRGCVRARVPALRRPGQLPAHPGAVGPEASRVLRSGRAIARRGPGLRWHRSRAAPQPGGPGGGAGQLGGTDPALRGRRAGDTAADRRAGPRRRRRVCATS